MLEDFNFKQPENFSSSINNQEQSAQEENSDLPEASNQPIFSPGEVFDAQVELIKLQNYHGVEGLEKIKEFKNKLRYQKFGLANIEVKLLDYLETNDNLRETEIITLLMPETEKYALTPEQVTALKQTIKEFVVKNQAIKKTIAPYQDQNGKINGEGLFVKLFKKEPEGSVDVVVNSYSIYFRPNNNNDYCYVASGAYKKKRILNEGDLELAATSGGAKLSSYPNKKLNGLITIQNAELFNDVEATKIIMAHERRHVINDVAQKYFVMPENDEVFRKYQNLKKAGRIQTPDDEAQFIELSRENLDIERRIKDEIFAYFKGGTRPKKISQMLLADDTVYNYVYSYNLHEEKDFDLEYLDLVEDGIVSFAEFIRQGYSVDETISLLLPEPLNKWSKTLERMTSFKRTPAKWQRKKENYISRRILKRDMLLKEADQKND